MNRSSSTSAPALESGPASVRVIYQFDSPPVVDGERLTELPFSLSANGVSVKDDITTLTVGASAAGILVPRHVRRPVGAIDRVARDYRRELSRAQCAH
ncbi:MAG: hypothetical protein ACOC8L_14890, partial [Spirochaetota bacterium]